jgi:hypothetical protein
MAAQSTSLTRAAMITREDVVSAYTLLLGRHPENDKAIASWMGRCNSTDELVRDIIGTGEFSARSLSVARAKAAQVAQTDMVHLSSVEPDQQLVHWLESLDGIQGWLSPGAAFVSAGLAQFQFNMGYGGNIAEIGVYHGKYLTGLACTLRADEKAIAIDVFDEQFQNADVAGYDEIGSSGIHSLTQQAFLDNAALYCPDARVEIIKRSSLEVHPQDILEFGDKVRFFSVDGGHTCEVLLNDLRLAEATLAPHGLISIDDILNPQWPGIVTGTVRFLDGTTKLRPVAFITNKLLCAFEPFVDVYKKALFDIAPRAIQRRDVEFSNYTADQYLDGDDYQLFLSAASRA